MVPAAAPKRAASLCLALLPLAVRAHAHPHAHDHAVLLLGEGQPLDGLQSELFAPSAPVQHHSVGSWQASVDLGDGRYAWLFGDSLVSRVARSPARRVMDDAWLPASTVGIIGAPAAGAAWRDSYPTYEEDDDEARRRSARAAANKKLLSRTSADEDGEVV